MTILVKYVADVLRKIYNANVFLNQISPSICDGSILSSSKLSWVKDTNGGSSIVTIFMVLLARLLLKSYTVSRPSENKMSFLRNIDNPSFCVHSPT